MVSSARMCIICKGSRALCGNARCPLLPRFDIAPKALEFRNDFFGPGYSVFVGRMGYPVVMAGPLVAIEDKPDIDSPAAWYGQDYAKVIGLRSSLLRSKHGENIFSKSRFVRDSQEVALASRPTDVEMLFKGRPFFRASFSDVHQPMGPSVAVQKMELAGNPHVPAHIEKLVSDELKARDAGMMMYERGEDVYRISNILSSGALGLERAKKLVPTRWSITATDSMVFDGLIEEVRTYPSINEFLVFESQYLDNHFVILMMPGAWEFENFEAWSPGSTWAQSLKSTEIIEEYEPFHGRTTYAENEGGGYYASRIACVQKLVEMRKQARVVVFREISEGYVVPLGVWVVRETARHAYQDKPPLKFATKEEALAYVNTRTRIPIAEYVKQSRVLGRRTLLDFGARRL
ncbi:MAG: hypothetical protein FJY76_02200 [Candidatus Aenigmarchaeota archaeon]|nr:hypothetical protein [Candidatus Aenigmarchaeota archaeon]